MDSTFIIGNLTRDPEVREAAGHSVTTFSVAVNKRTSKGVMVKYFDVSAWHNGETGGLGNACAKSLRKGSKVAIRGEVNCRAWVKDGEARCTLTLTASEVEFLTSKAETQKQAEENNYGMTAVDTEEIPF